MHVADPLVIAPSQVFTHWVSLKQFLGTAVVCSTLLLGLVAAPAPATFPGPNGSIVFIRSDDLWMMNADGSNQTLLIDDPPGITEPDWAPDSRHIAFKRALDIWILDLADMSLTNLTNTPDVEEGEPSWSPDGTQIAFARVLAGNWDVYRMPVAGGEAVQLTTDPDFDGYPNWSPDGTTLAFTSDRFPGEGTGVYLMPADTGEPETKLADATVINTFPDWSPDGTQIAYFYAVELYVVNVADGTTAPLTDQGHAIFGLSWSPDGTQIAFTSGQTGDNEVFVHTANGDINLSQSPNTDDRLPDWSNVEIATGTDGDDVIVGTPGDDLILGGDGNDVIDGGGGNDVIAGGDGNDRIAGGAGDDELSGGIGADVLIGEEDTGGDIRQVYLAARTHLGGGDDVLDGGGGADSFSGGAGIDSVFGRGGNDVIFVDDHADVVRAGAGADRINGGGGSDKLFGDGGDDLIRGGSGTNRFNGGAGIDTCIYNSTKDTFSSCEKKKRAHKRAH